MYNLVVDMDNLVVVMGNRVVDMDNLVVDMGNRVVDMDNLSSIVVVLVVVSMAATDVMVVEGETMVGDVTQVTLVGSNQGMIMMIMIRTIR